VALGCYRENRAYPTVVVATPLSSSLLEILLLDDLEVKRPLLRTMRTTSPGSTTTSPRTMIPPHNPFANAPASGHLTTLAAPNPPLTGSRSPGYSSHSYSHSTSPSTGSGSLPELQSHDQSMMIISPTQISSASLNAQKRAYRQRRKDPSCDACRERKVKVCYAPCNLAAMRSSQ
jgi:hypothetical protein